MVAGKSILLGFDAADPGRQKRPGYDTFRSLLCTCRITLPGGKSRVQRKLLGNLGVELEDGQILLNT